MFFVFSLQQFYYDVSRYDLVFRWSSLILNLKTNLCHHIWTVLDHHFFKYFSSLIFFFSLSETPLTLLLNLLLLSHKFP